MRKGQKNQLANEDGTPVTAVTLGLTMKASAPRISSRIAGDGAAQGGGPERPGLGCRAGQVARVVGGILGPAQATSRDDQHYGSGPQRPRA